MTKEELAGVVRALVLVFVTLAVSKGWLPALDGDTAQAVTVALTTLGVSVWSVKAKRAG